MNRATSFRTLAVGIFILLVVVRIPAILTDGRFWAEDRISAAMVSSSTARFNARRIPCSRRSISVIEVERISTFMLADSGIEFTEVPPRITPMLNVVFGEAGTGVAVVRIELALEELAYEDEGVATLEDGLYVMESKLSDPAFVANITPSRVKRIKLAS